MNITSKTLALLFAAMFLIIPVAAVEDEEICVLAQDPFSVCPHLVHISFTAPQEIPEHAELSPFFREDLVETEETGEICDEVTAWFRATETSFGSDGSILSEDTGEEIPSAAA